MIWIDDSGNFFKNPLHYNGRMIFNPSAETLIAVGYHEYVPAEPEEEPEPVQEPVENSPEPIYRFSKYKIKQLLGDEGWAAMKQELIDADLYEDFLLAECLATDDPYFSGYWEDLDEETRLLLIAECQF